MIKYTITAIKKDGLRTLAFDNNGRNTYETEGEANKQLKGVIENNEASRVLDLVGKDLKVLPVECYSSGDATGIYFDN